MRRVVAPVTVGGADLPVDAEVLFSLPALHRDPGTFPEPDRFDPGRWLAGADRQPARGCFLPFGDGARRCIGDTFALAELGIVVATIAARWRLEPVPGHAVRPAVHATIHPRSLPMVVRPR